MELITEENEWNKDLDNSGYSITKFGAEMEVWRASQEDVEVVIVNPRSDSWRWGLDNGVLENYFNKFTIGLNTIQRALLGFVGVEDVVTAMILFDEFQY